MRRYVYVSLLVAEFHVHCGKDPAKRCILLSKIILRSLNIWPDNNDAGKRWLMYIVIINLSIMGAAHFAYVLINITAITKMTTACTTVLVVMETITKIATMIYYRFELNYILTTIWKDFWPCDFVSETRLRSIKFESNFVIASGASFLGMAFFSNAQFMMYPLIENVDELPLASWYPFDFRKSPTYELMYIWQWFFNQVVITTLSGFDVFFNGLVVICATQFQVLHEVLKNMCSSEWRGRHIQLLKTMPSDGIYDNGETDVLVGCVKRHLHLIKVCNMIETIFSHIVFLQFVLSTAAMCVSSVALIADPDVWQHMLSYLIAHVFQFFVYCSVGNELTFQSLEVSEAAYYSEWQSSQNINFRRGLIMIIQRAQRPVSLTVAGLMQLSYANFIATVQLSFSFYTLLNSFV